MNIFILDNDIKKCARYHCDQHVVKMILESAQLLCTPLSKKGFITPYKSTHINHPCVRWVEASYANFLWLKRLAIELNLEYRHRFKKHNDHKSISVLKDIAHCKYRNRGLTEFAQAMPEQYKVPGNAIKAYRRFYREEKIRFATWTNRAQPKWLS